MKDIMTTAVRIIAATVALAVCLCASGAEEREKEMFAMSIQQLKHTADSLLDNGKTLEAAEYLFVLGGRYDKDMPREQQAECAAAYNRIGTIYFNNEIYLSALDFYLKSMKIAEHMEDNDEIARCYNNIANIYNIYEDNYQAYEFYRKALEYSAHGTDRELRVKILINITGVCISLGLPEESQRYYTMMAEAGKDYEYTAYYVHFCKELMLAAGKDFAQAEEAYLKAIDYSLEKGMLPMYTASAYGQLGALYEKEGKNELALHYYDLNNRFAEENDLRYIRLQNLKAYYMLCHRLGQREKAFRLQDEYITINDTVFNKNEYDRIRNTQLVHEMDRTIDRVARLSEEKKMRQEKIEKLRVVLLTLSGCAVVFILLSVVLYLQKRKLNRAYSDIFQRNSELLQAEQSLRKQKKSYETRIEELEQKLLAETPPQEPATVGAPEEQAADREKEKAQGTSQKMASELKDTILKSITQVMEETDEFCDDSFSLERLAALVGSNSKYVSVIINETFGKNFRAFVNEYRIKEASMRLLDTEKYGNYTVKAVGESVGYKSYANFSDIFKRHTGLTPAIYQKLASQNSAKTSD